MPDTVLLNKELRDTVAELIREVKLLKSNTATGDTRTAQEILALALQQCQLDILDEVDVILGKQKTPVNWGNMEDEPEKDGKYEE